MVTGRIVTDEVLITRNRIWSSLAVSLSGLSSCRAVMALRPIGVAALSSPRALAARFMSSAPSAGWPAGTEGKSRRRSGRNSRASHSTAPPASPTRRMPSHRHMTPVRPRATSKAVLAVSNMEETTSWNASG